MTTGRSETRRFFVGGSSGTVAAGWAVLGACPPNQAGSERFSGCSSW